MDNSRQELQSEVLAELAKMETEEVPSQTEPSEEIEKKEEGEPTEEVKVDSSSSQDVEKKDDGANSKNKGLLKRVNTLTRRAKEAEEREAKKDAIIAELEASKVKPVDTQKPELDEEGMEIISRIAEEKVKAILEKQKQKQEELSVKNKQDEMISMFQEKVMEDYSTNYDPDIDGYDEKSSNEIVTLFNKLTLDPEYWQDKIVKDGAKSTYKKYISGESVEQPKKPFPKTPTSNTVVEKKAINTKLTSKAFAEEAVRQALEEINGR